jgi:glutathione S-transferase
VKVYGAPQSSSSRRVLLTAATLGVGYELVPIDLRDPVLRAKVAAINPNAKIPVLEDEAGDFRLWESHAIMQYLCERTPGQTLYPVDPRTRADVNRWLFWASAHLSPAVGGICFERLWKGKLGLGGPDDKMVAYHERFLHQFAKVADDHVATRTWFVGESPTLADLSIAATLMYRKRAQLPLDAHKHLTAWAGRVHELPAWRATEPGGAWA